MNTERFENLIGIKFKDEAILKQAFTHRSYLNENRSAGLEHNERLEFLGDAVLELAITEYLYKRFTDFDEGKMTALRSALVNADTCAEVARKLGVGDFLLLSKGQAKDAGKALDYILANALEAIIGAIYLDSGFGAAEAFILKYVAPMTDDIIKSGAAVDAKSLFQEKAQEMTGTTPTYKTLKESGPDHDKNFSVAVMVGGEVYGEGQGRSKQAAEQAAAANALEAKGWK